MTFSISKIKAIIIKWHVLNSIYDSVAFSATSLLTWQIIIYIHIYMKYMCMAMWLCVSALIVPPLDSSLRKLPINAYFTFKLTTKSYLQHAMRAKKIIKINI